MKLANRLFYYGIGLAIGIVIVIFFLQEKNTTFDYLPNARVLKDIRTKKIEKNTSVSLFFNQHKIDSTQLKELLQEGEIDFGESITDKDSCNVYLINSQNEPKYQVHIKNCDSVATITHAKFLTE
ncbi:hypothetical protein [Mesonia aquimarina]|uniref:hypothetical protein n=1 Tax=Mesonia aquimarina TaxID=1504967 RepID=UPI000EF63480|nr:hypothetical protein [Mesonia aquimarina]